MRVAGSKGISIGANSSLIPYFRRSSVDHRWVMNMCESLAGQCGPEKGHNAHIRADPQTFDDLSTPGPQIDDISTPGLKRLYMVLHVLPSMSTVFSQESKP